MMGKSQGALGVFWCRRCMGIGHVERDCPTRVNHPGLNHRPETRRTVTNLEITDNGGACIHMHQQSNNDDEGVSPGGDYYGYINDGGEYEQQLPSYHGLLGGRPYHFLVDSGATGNFSPRSFYGTMRLELATSINQEAL